MKNTPTTTSAVQAAVVIHPSLTGKTCQDLNGSTIVDMVVSALAHTTTIAKSKTGFKSSTASMEDSRKLIKNLLTGFGLSKGISQKAIDETFNGLITDWLEQPELTKDWVLLAGAASAIGWDKLAANVWRDIRIGIIETILDDARVNQKIVDTAVPQVAVAQPAQAQTAAETPIRIMEWESKEPPLMEDVEDGIKANPGHGLLHKQPTGWFVSSKDRDFGPYQKKDQALAAYEDHVLDGLIAHEGEMMTSAKKEGLQEAAQVTKPKKAKAPAKARKEVSIDLSSVASLVGLN